MQKIISNFYTKLTNHENQTLQNSLQKGTTQKQDFPTQLSILHDINNQYLGITD